MLRNGQIGRVLWLKQKLRAKYEGWNSGASVVLALMRGLCDVRRGLSDTGGKLVNEQGVERGCEEVK